MLPKEITSLQHPIVKTFVKLQSDKKFRHEKRQIVLAGTKLVLEAQKLDTLLVLKGHTPPTTATETYTVTEEILRKVTGLKQPEPFAALAAMPKWQNLKGKQWILGLDGVSDPGNLGTLLRTALALGWEGAFLTETCVDPFNDKAIRAAKGASLRLPLQMGTHQELVGLGPPPLVASMEGKPLETFSPSPCILILGNEATGVTPELKNTCQNICIPIKQMESLNVAAAGAILLYGLKNPSCQESPL